MKIIKEILVSKPWLTDYLQLYEKALGCKDANLLTNILELSHRILKIDESGKKVIVLGNGGSAAIASHISVDLSKNARIRAVNFNEADLITCLANDYGYNEWMSSAISIYGDCGDLAILISSSGKSVNLVNAAKAAKDKGILVVSFTGFEKNNPLSQEGEINFWVNSKAYNVVENVHNIWLSAVVDAIIGKAEYPAC